MRVLIFVAHPDDEVLGMGGTILKYSQNGDFVKVVYLATGITSRRSTNFENNASYKQNKDEIKIIQKEIKDLRNDAKKSCNILKVKNLEFYDFPDNEMDSVPLLKIVKVIEKEIKMTKPDIVYTHHSHDLNIDHRTVFNAVLTATRPVGTNVKEIISFEIPSSTEWNYPLQFNPNYFVNIELQLSAKIKAMKAYENEIRDFPHPRSAKNLENVASRWGSVSGTISAEAFEIIRKIEY
jgi:LmbE family N-acetylglucosaminyl deacetylase|tara:strand:+ start:600 stop:1310 length:711 start_codon:yes stop_codon:yes gene_type:complete